MRRAGMSKVDDAIACFDEGFNCSQSVFSTYCEQLGLDKETGLKISCGLGGGMGRMAETCGAVTGAFLLIGLKYGKHKADDAVSKEKTYELVREFADKFKEMHGSIKCRDLLGCDISTPEGMAVMTEKGLHITHCRKLVADSSELIEELLELE
jgi:C_GCAxxG_C_C family probable redox protein